MDEALTLTILGCSGTYPGPGDACSGYLVRAGDTAVVVDLGTGTLANLQVHLDPGAVDALVLSHEHPDHWLDLPILRNALRYLLHVEGLAVHGTAGVLAAARTLIGEVAPTFVLSPIAAGDTLTVGDITFGFSRTDHPVETLAVRAESDGRSFLYSADTGPGWDPSGFGDGVDLFVCEATFRPDEEGGVHLSARQAGQIARKLGAGRLVVTHVSPLLEDEPQLLAAADAYGGPVELARTGLTFTA